MIHMDLLVDLSPEDVHATTLIHRVEFKDTFVNVLSTSYCAQNVAYLVVQFPCNTRLKYQVFKTDEIFKHLIVKPFQKHLESTQDCKTKKYIQEVFVNRFYLSPNDLFKYLA
jgi:hypothetical protein